MGRRAVDRISEHPEPSRPEHVASREPRGGAIDPATISERAKEILRIDDPAERAAEAELIALTDPVGALVVFDSVIDSGSGHRAVTDAVDRMAASDLGDLRTALVAAQLAATHPHRAREALGALSAEDNPALRDTARILVTDRAMASAVEDGLAEIPEFTTFPTVAERGAQFDELAGNHGVTLREIGRSQAGYPLRELTIGDAPRHAVIVGDVHPNEPVGALTSIHLARTLIHDAALRDRLGYTWHIIESIDPDGARLNEGWYKGPFTREHYARHFYRPPLHEQAEWTFPFSYKLARFDQMLPETIAFKGRIDDIRPAFMCTLHNSELGGVYYYLSRRAPGLYQHLQAIPATVDLPLNLADVRDDVPYAERLADAVWRKPHLREAYDLAEAAGLDPVASLLGMSSVSYATRYGTLTLEAEVPLWTHPDATDPTPTDQSFAEALATRARGLRQTALLLGPSFEAVTSSPRADSPLVQVARNVVRSLDRAADQAESMAGQPENARPATRAEQFGCTDSVHLQRLRYGGMLLRALDEQIATSSTSRQVREVRAALARTFDGWVEEAVTTTPPEPAPFGKLAAVQYAAILATSAYAITR